MSPLFPLTHGGALVDERFTEHFWRRVIVTDSCWIWATPTHQGYGRVAIARVRKMAHVWTWESIAGQKPAGMQLDHLCRVRACVRPSHLRLVTPRENTLAPGALSFAKVHSERTHCPYGHPYDEANTYIYEGRRRCRVCINAQQNRRRARKRAERHDG